MSLIFVNREIFNNLPSEDLKKEYIKDCILKSDYCEHPQFEYFVKGIFSVVSKNEKIIEKYGMKSYIREDYPAYDHVSGYYYSTGKYVICPFDWSVDDSGSFDYSFSIAKNISFEDDCI